ncbi:MAG: hypothetical protein JOS17DRAFT_796855 [Linnemannia elongata]|nr:MAG: hypothetical protein JOS17DRAFT_796855 [Linnemannia elongata]
MSNLVFDEETQTPGGESIAKKDLHKFGALPADPGISKYIGRCGDESQRHGYFAPWWSLPFIIIHYHEHQKQFAVLSISVPNEIWERILSYLYPSQLSQMSMVDKNLSEIVSSLAVWPRMFYVAHGSKAQLRPLVCIPRFQSSYMMFMCALSLHVCEKCFGLTEYNAGELYKLPLPIPVLLLRRSTDAIKFVGDSLGPVSRQISLRTMDSGAA